MTLPKLSVTTVQVPLNAQTGNRELLNVGFNLYPNPATQQTKLTANGLNGEVTVTVTDMLGCTLKTIREKATDGYFETIIDINSFEKGVYVVKVRNNNLSGERKLVVK
jgi:YbbR domain-containing protein